nr:MAG TPA: protein of unknown function (DUF1833) [Caudoviricetes sp.]
MTQNEVFNALHRGGAFSLPYLIKMYHPTYGTLYFVNNNEDVIYNGNTYHASNFKYTRPQTIGGVLKNGILEITAIDNEVIDIIEKSDELFEVTAVGVLDKAGSITAIKTFKHQYGTAVIDEQMKVVISFTNDDRLEMTFPPYVFDADNNRGNA